MFAPIDSSASSTPARVGLIPTSVIHNSASGCTAAATIQNAAELMSPGICTSAAVSGLGNIEIDRPSTSICAPMAVSIRSVWSLDWAISYNCVWPSARRAASIKVDLSWALATGRRYSIPVKFPPENTSGASVSFRRPLIAAPIWLRGSTTLPIGLELSELSPVRTAIMSRPPRTPDISRIVVPLLPASRITPGSARLSAAPLMRSESPESSAEGVRSTCTPRALMMLTVDVQSSPGEKLVTRASPLARLLKMTDRCEIDLSPGALMTPRKVDGLLTVMAMWR